MKCTVCGARMHAISTDLPFKLSEERIVIFEATAGLAVRSVSRVSH